MIPPENKPTPEENPETPNPQQADANAPETDAASTPNEAADRSWESAALSADNAVRSTVDRARPMANRLGAWAGPVVQRLRERVAPYMPAAEGTQNGRRGPSRVRAMQAGAGIAAVGVVGVLIGNAGGGSQDVEPAAMQSPSGSSATGASSASAGSKEAPAQPGPPAEGIDVSNHNGNVDWNKVAESGKKFTFVLSSDGEDFSSKKFDEQYQGAKDAGLMAGAYHFGRPDEDPVKQADKLLQNAKYTNDGKTLPPVLDLEPDTKGDNCYSKSPAEMNEWTKTFNDKVKKETGKDAIIYVSPSFWKQCAGSTDQFKQNPLWLASYGVSDPKVPGGWEQETFHQYSSTGNVPGISGPTDLNRFNGSIDELKKWAN